MSGAAVVPAVGDAVLLGAKPVAWCVRSGRSDGWSGTGHANRSHAVRRPPERGCQGAGQGPLATPGVELVVR